MLSLLFPLLTTQFPSYWSLSPEEALLVPATAPLRIRRAAYQNVHRGRTCDSQVRTLDTGQVSRQVTNLDPTTTWRRRHSSAIKIPHPLTQMTQTLTGADDLLGVERQKQRGAVGHVELRLHQAPEVGGVVAVTGGQAGHEECSAGRLDVVGEGDKGAAEGGLYVLGVHEVGFGGLGG